MEAELGPQHPQRLDKYLSSSSNLWKPEVAAALEGGRVVLLRDGKEGRPVKDGTMLLYPKDIVSLDGRAVPPYVPSRHCRVVALYKPLNLNTHLSTVTISKKTEATMDRRPCMRRWMREMQSELDASEPSSQPARGHRLFPVGRLDKKTTGLLLATNCGNLCWQLCDPGAIEKEYVATVYSAPRPEQLAALRAGVELSDGHAAADSVEVLSVREETETKMVRMRRKQEAVVAPAAMTPATEATTAAAVNAETAAMAPVTAEAAATVSAAATPETVAAVAVATAVAAVKAAPAASMGVAVAVPANAAIRGSSADGVGGSSTGGVNADAAGNARAQPSRSGRAKKRQRPEPLEEITVRKTVCQLRLVIRMGKNRIVRRMLAHVGLPVMRLHRSRIGGLTLESLGLQPSEHIPLSCEHVRALWAAAGGVQSFEERRALGLRSHAETMRAAGLTDMRLEEWLAGLPYDWEVLRRCYGEQAAWDIGGGDDGDGEAEGGEEDTVLG